MEACQRCGHEWSEHTRSGCHHESTVIPGLVCLCKASPPILDPNEQYLANSMRELEKLLKDMTDGKPAPCSPYMRALAEDVVRRATVSDDTDDTKAAIDFILYGPGGD